MQSYFSELEHVSLLHLLKDRQCVSSSSRDECDTTDGLRGEMAPRAPLPPSVSAVQYKLPPLTSDVQAVPAPDLAFAVQHGEAPLVRHPD